MKVEILTILKHDDDFCNSKEAFLNLLKTKSSIKIKESNGISYKIKTRENIYKYQLFTEDIPGKNQRYFHLILVNNNEENSDVEFFNSLVRSIKKLLQRVNNENATIDIIWDDISYYYSLQAYPIINEIENLMRKLIIKFMVVNVGIEWISTTTPDEIRDKFVKRGRSKNVFQSILYETDFIQLADFLFKKYRTTKQLQVDSHLGKAVKKDEIDFELLKNYIPKSNWERYFEGNLEYTAENLQIEWSELYHLRNKIAHNRGIEKTDLTKIQELATKIKNALTQAIHKLEQGTIAISEDQKLEIISEAETVKMTSEEELVFQAVKESDRWLENQLKFNADAFIGYNYFIDNQLNSLNISKPEAAKILNGFKEKGLIEIYYHEDKDKAFFPLKAIKMIK